MDSMIVFEALRAMAAGQRSEQSTADSLRGIVGGAVKARESSQAVSPEGAGQLMCAREARTIPLSETWNTAIT